MSATVRNAAVVLASGCDWKWPEASSRKNVALNVIPFDVSVGQVNPCTAAEYWQDDGTSGAIAGTPTTPIPTEPAALPLPIPISTISAPRSSVLPDDGPVTSVERHPASAIVDATTE